MTLHSFRRSSLRHIAKGLLVPAIIVGTLLAPATAYASSQDAAAAAGGREAAVALVYKMVGPFPNWQMCDDYRWYVISQGRRTLPCNYSDVPRPGWYFWWE